MFGALADFPKHFEFKTKIHHFDLWNLKTFGTLVKRAANEIRNKINK